MNSLSITPGIWILSGNAYFAGITTYGLISISGASGQANNYSQQLVQGSGNVCLNLTALVTNPTTSTQYLVAQVSNSISANYVTFKAIRIG
jgi:hypothetical protein